jgi:hypothetical protein
MDELKLQFVNSAAMLKSIILLFGGRKTNIKQGVNIFSSENS